MKNCPYCAHKNREGYLFCEDCGRPLSGSTIDTLPTKHFEVGTRDLPNGFTSLGAATWGTANFQSDSSIVLVIRDADAPINVRPEKRLIFGRADNTSVNRPDIDLTPFGALEKGVSRTHCAIYRDDLTLTIVDLGSANGTHLNGQRLTPEVPRVLRDGDEIQFGMLVAHIYFKATSL
ncbi:MAG: FHA domain-containing protein [bacterium]|nr:FHA domain-containing protein [bacterium]